MKKYILYSFIKSIITKPKICYYIIINFAIVLLVIINKYIYILIITYKFSKKLTTTLEKNI